MKYFDTHIHFFPDKLAGKALPKLREISKCETYSDGTRAGTVKNLEAWGCAGGMALHIATNAHQQTSVNDFAQESQGGNIYCFGSVLPFAENAMEELHRVKEMGLYHHRCPHGWHGAAPGGCPVFGREKERVF